MEFFEDAAVERAAGLLVVRIMWTADVGAFLPGEAEPAEVGEHGVDEIEAEAGGVEIVVAEDERTAGEAGAFGGDPEGACVPKMQIPGGRGGEAAAIVGGRIHHCVEN